MRRFLVFLCWLGFAPLSASALGLGDIELDSALNQPFAAQIPVESFEQDDLNSLRVSLASADTFERYGLDLPLWMQGFEFAIDTDGAAPVVRISSQRPVAEPFVTLLLDIKWSSGRLLREYTVLLDPPLFEPTPVQPAVAPAEAAPEQPVARSDSAGTVSRPAPVVEPAPVAVAEPAPVAAPAPAQPESAAADPVTGSSSAPQMTGSSYTVQRKDTLWGIADRVRGSSDMTVNQVMLALYRANPEAFLGNINRLKAGAILRVPDAGELGSLSPAEAAAAVREQNAALQGAAAPSPAVPESSAEPAQLTLVVPDADAAGDSGASTADPAATTAEAAAGLDAAARNAEAGRMQSRIDELEGELSESQRLLEARDAELAAMQRRLAVLESARDSGAGDALVSESIIDDVPVEDLPSLDDAADDAVADAAVEEGVADAAAVDADTPFADEAIDEVTDQGAEEAAEVADAADVAAGESAPGVPAEQQAEEGSLFSNIWFWVSAAVVLLLALFVARRGKRDEDDELLDAEASGSWEQQALDADHAETMRDLEALPQHDDSIVVEEGEAGATDAADTQAGDFDADSTSSLDDLLDDAVAEAGGDAAEADADKTTELQLPDEGDTETPLEKTISTGGLVDLDQADPIAEADFHMAYGLYDQAAELLERSLESEPDNRDCRVKLIEVFFVWENREGFLTHARALHESVSDQSDPEWNKVVILGKQLCPEDELFSGSDAAAPTADSMDFEFTDLGDDGGETELDFTLGGGEGEAQALDANLFDDAADSEDGAEAAEADDDLDFDLGAGDDSDADLALDLGEDDLGDDTDDSATTMESPTVEADMADAADETLETPTIESPAVDHAGDDAPGDELDVDLDIDGELLDDNAATMETPTLETDMNEATLESPTLESGADGGGTAEMPALDAYSFDSSDIDLDLGGVDDLDVDLSGLGDDADDDTESVSREGEATAEIPLADDDATLLADVDEVIGENDETLVTDAADLEAEIEAELEAQSEASEVSSDTVEQPQIDPAEVELGETAEQPAISDPGEVDFDLGMEADAGDDVARAIEEASLPEDATMTEVGTKLDLARAYIDMGDPDGARSILNEVLDEGGDEQQQEARQLLEELGD